MPFGDFLNSSSILSDLRRWKEITFLNEEQLIKLERTKLQKLLNHAVKNVDAYQSLKTFEQADPYQWLANFPVLKKNK